VTVVRRLLSHAIPLESHMKTVAALLAAVAIAALTLLPSTPNAMGFGCLTGCG
jgi:hypothetical protein